MSFKISNISRVAKVGKTSNKPYTQLLITTDDGRKASGFGSPFNDKWVIGDTILDSEATLEQNGQYLNIKMAEKPKKGNADLTKEFDAINAKLDIIIDMISKAFSEPAGKGGLNF